MLLRIKKQSHDRWKKPITAQLRLMVEQGFNHFGLWGYPTKIPYMITCKWWGYRCKRFPRGKFGQLGET